MDLIVISNSFVNIHKSKNCKVTAYGRVFAIIIAEDKSVEIRVNLYHSRPPGVAINLSPD